MWQSFLVGTFKNVRGRNGQPGKAPRRNAAGCKPALEALEDRTLLSVSLPGGMLDPTFGQNGIVTNPRGEGDAMVLQGDGKVVVAGVYNGVAVEVARYNPDGSLDA